MAQRETVAAREIVGPSGEFRCDSLEAAFNWSQLGETLRYGRWLLLASAILNGLFLLSDWRFYGTPQFWIAIPARLMVIAGSVGCMLILARCHTPRAARMTMAGWMAITALGVTVLVSSHSELALFVVLLLPMIFYLGAPLPFGWILTAGMTTSGLLLAGYEFRANAHGTGLGLGLALLTLNCCLTLVVARSNRLQRLEWQATRSARAFADELAINRQTLEKIFDATPVPMVITAMEDGRIIQVNDGCASMFSITPEMVGTESFAQFYADPDDRERLMARVRRDGRVVDFESQARCAGGALRTVLVKTSMIDLPTGKALISGIIDISERKAVELSLEWLASTDPLTRLPNRLSFFSTARAEMMRATRLGKPMALLMIDLDHFKAINDSFGHHGGDQALKAFGALCLNRLRGTDIIGRLGGEEFGILLPDTDAPQALMIAEALCHGLSELRVAAPNDELRLSASIGMTMLRRSDSDLDTALARADQALYTAKRMGRARVHLDPADVAITPLAALKAEI